MMPELSHNSGNPHFVRAELLIDQNRWELAEPHLRLALATDPSNATAHAYLAICHLEKSLFEDATAEAEQAIGLEPDSGYNHYVHSLVMGGRGREKEALASIEEALRLYPHDARFWGRLAEIHINAKQFQKGLEAAENALSIDPESGAGLNLRALALRGLGRKAEAAQTVQGALAKNPDDPVSHANQGWGLLHQGDPKQALVHFREALRLNPELEWAKAGLVEAMKARYWPYRIFLAYFLFMRRFTAKAQWAIVLGGFLGYQAVRAVGQANPGLRPYTTALILAYLAFVLGGWFAIPLSNLLLRLNRFGRYALNREQTLAANSLGLVLGAGIIALIGWGVTGADTLQTAALVLGLLIVPVAAAGVMPAGIARIVMVAWAGIAVVTAIALIGSQFVLSDRVVDLVWMRVFQPYIWLCILSMFGGNIVATFSSRRV